MTDKQYHRLKAKMHYQMSDLADGFRKHLNSRTVEDDEIQQIDEAAQDAYTMLSDAHREIAQLHEDLSNDKGK